MNRLEATYEVTTRGDSVTGRPALYIAYRDMRPRKGLRKDLGRTG